MEKKYFISYVAYLKNYNKFDMFNDIIHTAEEITSDLINRIQISLVDRLNENTENNPYETTQIINFILV